MFDDPQRVRRIQLANPGMTLDSSLIETKGTATVFHLLPRDERFYDLFEQTAQIILDTTLK